MTTRIFASALFAGLLAGLVAVLLQWSLMEKLILEGEEYETGAKSHFAGVLKLNEDGETAEQAAESGDGGEEEGTTRRFALAFFATFVTWVGWALLMVAGFALTERYGVRITMKDALVWGTAGFGAIHVMTGIGLPPELPGQPAAEIELRQMWWITTAATAVIGFALMGYGRKPFHFAAGIALLIAPHLIGAPRLDDYSGMAPPELSGEYVARSYAVAFISWIVLGLAAGYFWNRLQQPPA